MAWITAGKVSELPPGLSRCIQHGREGIAVFNIGGKFYACDDSCPHAGGPLNEGFVEGTRVSCPWHGWTFDLEPDPGDPPDGVRRFRVGIQGDDLMIEVPD